MDFVKAGNLLLSVGEMVATVGFVKGIMEGGKFSFVLLKDYDDGLLELVIASRKVVGRVPVGSIIVVEGKVDAAHRSPANAQIRVDKLYLLYSPPQLPQPPVPGKNRK